MEFGMKRIYLALAGAALVAASVGLYMFQSPQPKPITVPPYLEKASGETILPPDNRQEIQRRVVFAPDGFTRVRMVVYFVNGDTGVTVFHPDGSADAYRYYPSETAIDWKATTLSDKGLKSLVQRASDRKTIKMEQHWYETGKLKRLGQRLPAGGYQVDGFFEDGVSHSESSLYNNSGVLESQLMYYPGGQLKSSLKLRYNGLYKDWVGYFPDGKKSGFHTVEGSTERGEFYFEDGKTIRMKFTKELISRYFSGVSLVTAVYNNADGSLNHTRIWDVNGMRVVYPAVGKTPSYTQVWKFIDPKRAQNRLAADNLKLISVSGVRVGGIDNVDVTVGENNTVTEIRFVRKNDKGVEERVTRVVRADGTVESEVIVSAASGRTEQRFVGDAGGRVVVPAELLSGTSYDAPPSVPSDFTYPRGYF
jgi:hypothetical protein